MRDGIANPSIIQRRITVVLRESLLFGGPQLPPCLQSLEDGWRYGQKHHGCRYELPYPFTLEVVKALGMVMRASALLRKDRWLPVGSIDLQTRLYIRYQETGDRGMMSLIPHQAHQPQSRLNIYRLISAKLGQKKIRECTQEVFGMLHPSTRARHHR